MTDLAAMQVGQSFEISFTPPRLAEDGERLSKPLEVNLLRAILAPGESPKPGEKLGLWLTWQAADLSRYTSGQKVLYRARLSHEELNRWRGDTFQFALRALTRGFRHRAIESDISNSVAITLLDVSEPVKDLRVITTEKALELRWSPPERSLANRALTRQPAGYRIFRSTTRDKGPFVLSGESSSPEYEDRDFVFGRTYFYRVQAVFRKDGQTAESEGSQAEVTPKDTFPPAAPTGLTANYAQGTVDLVWNANNEPDLTGYNVYRREKDTAPVRANNDLVKIPLFHDSSVAPGHEYFYKVTAVDLAGNESPASAEASLQTQ